jgi:hypothetical protein
MMRNITSCLLIAALTILFGCAGDDDAQVQPPGPPITPNEFPSPTRGLWVTFQVENETFRALATRTDTINEVIEQVRADDTRGRHPTGRVVTEGQFNPTWSWHLDPQSFRFSQEDRIDCSAKPSAVEADVGKWISTKISYCPHEAKIIEVRDCRSGECRPFELPEDRLIARLTELNTQIGSMIADKSCTETTQCKTIAFGHKACGGPEGYHVYSTKNTDSKALRTLVLAYNRADRELDEILSQPSDCAFIVAPEVACTGGQCTATAPPSPSP